MKRIHVLLPGWITVLLISCSPQAPVVHSLPGALTDTTIGNVAYGSNASQKFDMALPADRTANTCLVLVIHGGGWSSGDKSELGFMTEGLMKRGFAVANMNYRLSPQASDNYAMQLDEIAAAVQFIISKSGLYIFSSKKIYVVGHSAGAHLALAYSYTRNTSGLVKAVGSIAGPTNLYNLGYYNPNVYGSILTPYLGMPLIPVTTASDLRYKNTSPLFQATPASPPTILFHGDVDLVVNNEQSSFLVNRLTELKVPNKYVFYSPFVGHDWWVDYARRDNTLNELKNWFNEHP